MSKPTRVMTVEQARDVLIVCERRMATSYQRAILNLAKQGITDALVKQPLMLALDRCKQRLRDLGVDPDADLS
jgi:hypothetical protein